MELRVHRDGREAVSAPAAAAAAAGAAVALAEAASAAGPPCRRAGRRARGRRLSKARRAGRAGGCCRARCEPRLVLVLAPSGQTQIDHLPPIEAFLHAYYNDDSLLRKLQQQRSSKDAAAATELGAACSTACTLPLVVPASSSKVAYMSVRITDFDTGRALGRSRSAREQLLAAVQDGVRKSWDAFYDRLFVDDVVMVADEADDLFEESRVFAALVAALAWILILVLELLPFEYKSKNIVHVARRWLIAAGSLLSRLVFFAAIVFDIIFSASSDNEYIFLGSP